MLEYAKTMKFEKKIIDTVVNYILREIYPQIEKGTYGRAQEEEEIKEFLKLYNEGKLTK